MRARRACTCTTHYHYTLTRHGVVHEATSEVELTGKFGLIAIQLIIQYYLDSIVLTPGFPVTMTTNTTDIIVNNDFLREDEGIVLVEVLDVEVSGISQPSIL